MLLFVKEKMQNRIWEPCETAEEEPNTNAINIVFHRLIEDCSLNTLMH